MSRRNTKEDTHIIEKKKPGRKPLPASKKRKEVKAYLLPEMIEWYLSQSDSGSFTDALERIAYKMGYKPKEADDKKEGAARKRLRLSGVEPLTCLAD